MIQIRELFIDGGRCSDRKRFNITDRKQPYFSWAAVSDIDGDHQSAYFESLSLRDRAVSW